MQGSNSTPDAELAGIAGLREAMRALPSAAHRTAFAAALEAVVLGTSGVFLAGQPGPDRTVFINSLLGILPAEQVVAMRVACDASPDAFAFVLQGVERDSVWRTARVLIVIDDADLLRRDTLDLINQSASSLLADEEGPQLLLLGRPSFEKRLVVNRHQALADYLQAKFRLDPAAPAGTAPDPGPAVGMVASAPLAPRVARPLERPGARPGAQPARMQDRSPGGRVIFWGASGLALAGIAVASALLVPLWLQDEAAGPFAGAAPPGLETSRDAAPGVAEPALVPPAAPKPDDALASAAPARGAEPSQLMQSGGPGLLLVARRGDTLATLYRSVYVGVTPPPFADVTAANPGPLRPGKRLIFPTPSGGWQKASERTDPAPPGPNPYAADDTAAGAAP